MYTMKQIKQELESGQSPADLIAQGFKKSTVYAVAKRLGNLALSPVVDDELAELRRKKERVKLEKEIADLEASRNEVPERLDHLEKRLGALTELVESITDSISAAIWISNGWNEEEAKKEADGFCRKTWRQYWRIIDGEA